MDEHGVQTFDSLQRGQIEWKATWLGFEISYAKINLTIESWWCSVPYWSVVVPLPALSAFLLLKKPKTSASVQYEFGGTAQTCPTLPGVVCR